MGLILRLAAAVAHRALAASLLVACGTPEPAPPAAPPEAPSGPIDVASGGLTADLDRTLVFSASRPAYERPLAVTGLERVAGLPNLSATTCRGCHPDLFDEWHTSVHAAAWIDPQYQSEIGKSGNRWLCLNCHTPLLTQQDRWPVALEGGDVERPHLVANPTFDPALRDEGITCAACHVRGDTIIGPGLGGDAPHPVAADPRFRSGALCLECHQAEATFPDKGFVCTFQTGDEWRDGPYDDEGRTCVDCHMPRAERPAAVGGPVRSVGRHWWKGAGIPKIAGRYPPPEANVPGLALDARRDGDALLVTATNQNAGHRLPTGDPERWVQLDVSFVGAQGAPLAPPTTERFMQVWAWEVPPRKVSDNRLAPREARELRIPIPAGAVVATVVGSSHRISKANAEYHGLGDYPRSVETHRLELRLE